MSFSLFLSTTLLWQEEKKRRREGIANLKCREGEGEGDAYFVIIL